MLVPTFLFAAVMGVAYNATRKVSYFRNSSLASEARLLATTNVRAQVRNQLLETFDVLYVSGLASHEGRLEEGKAEIQAKIKAMRAEMAAQAEVAGRELRPENTGINFQGDARAAVAAYNLLQARLDDAVRMAKRGDLAGAHQALLDARENLFQNKFVKEITDVIDDGQRESKLASQNLGDSISNLRTILVASFAAILALAVALSLIISRSIGKRLGYIESAAVKISREDFDIDLDESGSDEVSMLAHAMNHMASSLLEARRQISKQQELLLVTSKMSSLGEMAGGVAHEINNPLAVIQMKAEQLKDVCEENELDPEFIAKTCEIIVKTSSRMAKIVSGLRSFARDGVKDPFRKAAMESIVEETLSFCSEKFKNRGISLEIEKKGAPVTLECRATQISQVLLNLVNNAFDAVETLEQKWVRIEIRNLGQDVELSVTDSGNGIPEAIQKKLAQPFFTTKEIGKGTGLGLSISKGIVESHGGSFSLDTAHANTRFAVVLPIAQAVAKKAA